MSPTVTGLFHVHVYPSSVFCIYNRVVTYQESTMPIIKHYEAKGLVRKIDASRSEEEVKNLYHYLLIIYHHI